MEAALRKSEIALRKSYLKAGFYEKILYSYNRPLGVHRKSYLKAGFYEKQVQGSVNEIEEFLEQRLQADFRPDHQSGSFP